MQWLMESYHWNITMIVKRLIFHAKLETGYLENIRLLYCNFCDEYPLDMILYKEVFNTVLLPETLVLQTFFNPVLAAIPIKWPAEIMDIAQLSDVEFHYGDGFIYMGTEMAWVPFPAPTKLLAKKVMPQPTMKEAHRNSKF